MKRFTFLFLILTLALTGGQAQNLELSPVYGDGMVLQREQPLKLRGRTSPQQMVNVRLGSHTTSATADKQGNFCAVLPAQAAGGPFTLTFETKDTARTFQNVWVGEVWLCSGQSNMEMRLRDISSAQIDLKLADSLPLVHLYNMESLFPVYAEIWDEERMEAVDRGAFIKPAQWKVCSAKEAARFSAIGFHFARVLADSLKCHIGILSNAVGGSTTEGWIDSTSLAHSVPEILEGDWRENKYIMKWARNRADYNLQNDKKHKHSHPYAPGYLYHAAIRPLEGYPMRGVLWYQGESNADLVKMHERLFPLLETSWRKTWDNPQLPFYFVQLSSISTRPVWPEFRDSQRRLADKLPHTYMTVSSDAGDSLDVHPKHKRIIGQRMAQAALHHSYGYRQLVPCGPVPVSAATERYGEVRITFDQTQQLQFIGKPDPHFFELAGNDDFFLPAQEIRVKGNTLILRSAHMAKPAQVRYGWKPFTRANLVNEAGLPCSTFLLKVKPMGKN